MKRFFYKYKVAPVIFTLVLSFGIFGLSLFLQKEKPIVASNLTDLHVAQYSDQNITPNAIDKDSRFERLVFATPQKDSANYMPDQFATALRAFKMLFTSEIEKTQEEYGTWVWTPILQMTDEYMNEIVLGAEREDINTIYLSIDSYLDIYVLPEGSLKQEKRNEFMATLDKFLTLAKEKKIAVDAEAGWRNWAEPGHTYKPLAILNFVKEFNATSRIGFRGLQYDIEPYLLPEYKASDGGKKVVLQRFLKLVDHSVYYLKDQDLKFSVVVPDFYDKRDKMTPKFEYQGKKDFAFKHLLNILEERSGSSIIIMSYRNFAEGKDGSISVSANELKTTKRGRFSSNIIIAQEVGNVLPPYITFHNTSKEYFSAEVGKLRSSFATHRNFQGLAIHYANPYLELK